MPANSRGRKNRAKQDESGDSKHEDVLTHRKERMARQIEQVKAFQEKLASTPEDELRRLQLFLQVKHLLTQLSEGKVYERMDEYKVALDDLNQVSARRQTMNSVFLAINTFLGAGLGYAGVHIFEPTSLNYLLVLGVVGFVVNLLWARVIESFGHMIEARTDYIRTLERQFSSARLIQEHGEAIALGADEADELTEEDFKELPEEGLYSELAGRGIGPDYEMRNEAQIPVTLVVVSFIAICVSLILISYFPNGLPH